MEEFGGFPMGSSMVRGTVPALMRLHLAQGREKEARALAARFKAALRDPPDGPLPLVENAVLLAGIAAAEGERATAVRHLQQAMQQVTVPELFYPQLPWFKSLEGEPGYAEVVTELERRKSEIRSQIAALADT